MGAHEIKLATALLDNAANTLSDEERKGYDADWVAGYVTAMIHAAETMLEYEDDEAA